MPRQRRFSQRRVSIGRRNSVTPGASFTTPQWQKRGFRRRNSTTNLLEGAFGVTGGDVGDLVVTGGDADDESVKSSSSSLLPSWSVEDKSARVEVTASIWTQLIRINAPLAVVFLVFLVVVWSMDNTPKLQLVTLILIVTFIGLQTLSTLAQARPQVSEDTHSVDARTTAIMFHSMVLYPCLGQWIMEHDKAWTLEGFSNLWNLQDDKGMYTWGYVFPYLLWGMSAMIFSRSGYSSFTYDRTGIVTDPSRNAPMTRLYRQVPGRLEIMMAKMSRISTFSLWHVLDEDLKPSSHEGRFLFQLVAPTCITFLYIGSRFCAYSATQITEIIAIGAKGDFAKERLYGVSDATVKARFIVWTAFFVHCILLRAILPSRLFLRLSVPDSHSLKHRSVHWQQVVSPSKRSRVLWAFRGWTLAFVPFLFRFHYDTGSLSYLLHWLYISQYVSYFLEGLMALVWGINEATRHCQLHHPFGKFVSLFFWASYNAYLQPVGTIINIFFYFVLGENSRRIHLTELIGPLLNRNGEVRAGVVNILKRLLPDRGNTKKINMDERLDEWVHTWQRKRRDVGKSTDNYRVVKAPSEDEVSEAVAPVFSGSMFPKHEEYLYMRDHPSKFISMDFWDKDRPEKKFLSHYPTYAEEVQDLLKEKYDFDNKREVWMFGYGSLLSPDTPPSGLTERQSKLLIPYWLKKSAGYKNSWSYRHGSCGITALGLLPVPKDEAQNICGCIYPIDYELASELFSYREDGYELSLISVENFQAMHPSYAIPEGVGYIWVCGAPVKTCDQEVDDACGEWSCKRHFPTQDSPILQTYIDSIMTGALRYATSGAGQKDGMKFCAAILSTIQDWDHAWHNDRIIPGRPWVWRSEWQLIDGMLNCGPNTSAAFSNRLNANLVEPDNSRRQINQREVENHNDWIDEFFSGYTTGSPKYYLSTDPTDDDDSSEGDVENQTNLISKANPISSETPRRSRRDSKSAPRRNSLTQSSLTDPLLSQDMEDVIQRFRDSTLE